MESIIKKLPIELQQEFQTDFAKYTHWTPEWHQWAKGIMLQCDLARDANIITNDELIQIQNHYFSRLGGIIGEMPNITNLDFLDFLDYTEPTE